MIAAWRRGGLLLLLLIAASCARSGGTVEIMAAFSDDTVVGQLTARWNETGEERVGAMDNAAERKLAFTVDATNRLADRLYLRLRDFRLLDADGEVRAEDASVACALSPGTTEALIRGVIWLPRGRARSVRGFRIDRFAVPLGERGQAFYREFLLRQRPADGAAIDAEIAAYAAAPPCRGGG